MKPETVQGQQTPKGLVEVKHIVTPTGKVLQEFLPAKKKHKTRRG